MTISKERGVKKKKNDYLWLEIQKSKTKNKLTKYPSFEENVYINGVIYITPYTQSLFNSYSDLIIGL